MTCIAIPSGDFFASVRAVAAEIAALKPALILYLGVGMLSPVIALASLRLAPIQCASFGHTASTMSPAIDYFILPEDFVGSVECFSEKVVALPKTAMPFEPRTTARVRRQLAGVAIRAAIPASTMKLNPVLFDAVARIGAGAKAQIEFQFFPLGAAGLPYFELSRIVRAGVLRATVFPESPHDRYMERLAQCDLFLCPFPYGNMNSIIDAFQLRLPGVCLDGAEAHAHADAAFFTRIGLPAELTAKSVDEYVAAAIRLIDDAPWRRHCADIVRKADLDAAFFNGDASLFGAAIEELIWPSSA
jgi:predicted O-linked N-acetylglucosamine transferase (SPINDLY family)